MFERHEADRARCAQLPRQLHLHAAVRLRLATDSTALTQCSTFWALLPYLERQALYDSLPSNQTSSAYFNQHQANNSRLAFVNAYVCPSDQSGLLRDGTGATYNLNSYNVNGQVFVTGQYPKLALITDGTSNTVLFVEHVALCRDRAAATTPPTAARSGRRST